MATANEGISGKSARIVRASTCDENFCCLIKSVGDRFGVGVPTYVTYPYAYYDLRYPNSRQMAPLAIHFSLTL